MTVNPGTEAFYRDLDVIQDEIRLLYLQPSRDSTSQVQCTLKTVSLQDNPIFEALSYAWGDPAATNEIQVNGQRLKVNASASSALVSLRHERTIRTLWIDAICINQGRSDERASQVKLMGTIYRKAENVCVWLGLDEDGDGDVLSIVRDMGSTTGIKSTIGLNPEARERLKKVKRFFARSWWERLWVVQEVALGRSVTFHQGSQQLTYGDLLVAYKTTDTYFRENLKGYKYGAYSSDADKFMEKFETVNILSQIRNLCGVGAQRSERISLMTWATVANLLRDRKASVDKDRLYALYGLLPAEVVRSSGMEPSYTLPTEQVFIDATYSIMETSQSFMIFNFLYKSSSQDSEIKSSLPSWVPDWRKSPQNKYEANLRVAREPLFRASGATPFYMQRLGSNTLCLQGIFVDLVQTWRKVPIHPNMSPALDACHNTWRETWANTTPPDNAMAKKYLDGTSAETAFRRTMVWDCAVGSGEGDLKRLTQSEGLAMFEAHDLAVKIAFGEDRAVAGQTLSEADARRANYMMNCAKDRAFFITFYQLIGMTQLNIEAGDHIFIIAGNSHPVILRPSKKYADTWQAVGECYLHSFMDGQALMNRQLCAGLQEHLYADPAVKNIKGTERNPRWNEIIGEPEKSWEWILIE